MSFWLLSGFAICTAPMLGAWAAQPDIFLTRIRSAGATGKAGESLGDRLSLVPDALLYPFFDRHSGPYFAHGGLFFRHDPPFLGWLVVPFVAIGLVCWGVWAVRGLAHRENRCNPAKPRPEILLFAWLVISAAISQTESMESQRFLSITIIWALATGTGLVVTVTAIMHLLHLSKRSFALALLAMLVGIGAWNAHYFYSEDRQLSMYGDQSTFAAWDIAWRTQQLADLPRISLAGSNSLSYEGFRNWTFMVPKLAGLVTDVPAFGADTTKAPVVIHGELVVVGGQRDPAEVCAIQTRNPNALKGVARDRYGTLLYTVFTAGPTLMLTTAESPAESTLVPIQMDLCARG